MVQIKRFAAPQKCLFFKFHDVQTGRGGWKYSGLPARPENYCESKQTYLRYSLDKAFHLPEIQRKLFFTRNWVGGFKGENLVQRLPLTRALLEGFFLQFKPAAWWTSINRYHGFHALAKRRFFPCFSSTRKNMSAFEPFWQYFATGSDTASCQDYEEYEFFKLQLHIKLSQCTLATRLSSC